MQRERIFENHISDKELISRMYKQIPKLKNRKKKQVDSKRDKRLE